MVDCVVDPSQFESELDKSPFANNACDSRYAVVGLFTLGQAFGDCPESLLKLTQIEVSLGHVCEGGKSVVLNVCKVNWQPQDGVTAHQRVAVHAGVIQRRRQIDEYRAYAFRVESGRD